MAQVIKRTAKSKVNPVNKAEVQPEPPAEKPSNVNKNTLAPGNRRKKKKGGFRITGDD